MTTSFDIQFDLEKRFRLEHPESDIGSGTWADWLHCELLSAYQLLETYGYTYEISEEYE
jgi:hypothetical protein